MLHIKFYRNKSTGTREEDFRRGLIICGHGGHLVKISFSYVNALGPRSGKKLDLPYLHTFISLISCLHLPTFRSQAAVMYKKSTVFTFFNI